MSWNAMTYEGKDTVLRVVRDQAEGFFTLAEEPETWTAKTACPEWEVRDIVGHIVDTTEGYFPAFDAARSHSDDRDPPTACRYGKTRRRAGQIVPRSPSGGDGRQTAHRLRQDDGHVRWPDTGRLDGADGARTSTWARCRHSSIRRSS